MKQIKTSLCIIGGSGGGLSAALRAAEQGVDDIVIIERNKMLGGCFRYVSGIFGVDSQVQRDAGVGTDTDTYYRYHMDRANWTCDARLVRKWFQHSGEVLDWVSRLGLSFYNLTSFSGSSPLFHQGGDPKFPTGTTLARIMEARIHANDAIRVLLETRAHHLLTGPDGSVAGVSAVGPDGEELQITASCVVMSTGSISGNSELVKRFYQRDDLDKLKVMSNVPHNMGDGLVMAEEIGADTGAVSCLYIGPHNHPYNVRTGLILRRSQVMKLNIFGERFVDESLPNTEDWGWFMARAVDLQPGKTVFALLDQGLLDRMVRERANQTTVESFQGNFTSHDSTGDFDKENVVTLKQDASPAAWIDNIQLDLEKEARLGRVKISGSLAEIARWMGCDETALADSVRKYNRYCADGYDADFLKDPAYLQGFTYGPYYCLRSYSGVDTFIGGLLIDHEQRVIRRANHRPIPGLYAAGVMTSGWLGQNYGFYGSESSYTLYSGYSCGDNAAEYLKTMS